jgi:hypothetical protein
VPCSIGWCWVRSSGRISFRRLGHGSWSKGLPGSPYGSSRICLRSRSNRRRYLRIAAGCTGHMQCGTSEVSVSVLLRVWRHGPVQVYGVCSFTPAPSRALAPSQGGNHGGRRAPPNPPHPAHPAPRHPGAGTQRASRSLSMIHSSTSPLWVCSHH